MEQRFFNIDFKGLTFLNLKFKETVKNNYTEDYFDNLLKEDNHLNRVLYTDGQVAQIDDQIHVKVSWSFALKVLSIVGLVFAGLMGIAGFIIPALVVLGIGFAIRATSQMLNNHANEFYAAKEMTSDMVEFIFESN